MFHIDEVGAYASRIIHIGNGTESRFTLESQGTDHLIFAWKNSQDIGYWTMSLTTRQVVHVVLDTNLDPAGDRVKLYQNGMLMPKDNTKCKDPAKSAGVDLLTNRHLVLGNTEDGQRSPKGTIYYAALYEKPFTQARAAEHAKILLASDDAP